MVIESRLIKAASTVQEQGCPSECYEHGSMGRSYKWKLGRARTRVLSPSDSCRHTEHCGHGVAIAGPIGYHDLGAQAVVQMMCRRCQADGPPAIYTAALVAAGLKHVQYEYCSSSQTSTSPGRQNEWSLRSTCAARAQPPSGRRRRSAPASRATHQEMEMVDRTR